METDSQLNYREVFENTSDCIFIFDVTADGRIRLRELNRAAERMIQRPRATVIGKYFEEMASNQAVIETVYPQYRRCIATATPLFFQGHYDVLAGRLDLETDLVPLLNDAGRVYRLMAVTRNITTRLRMQHALHESEVRNREVFENSSDSIVVLELAGSRFKFASINPAMERSMGWTAARVEGKYLDEFLTDRVLEQALPAYRRCIETGEVVHYDVDIMPPAGPRYFSCAVIPLRDDSGCITRLMIVARDITRRREAEAVQQHRREELEARVAQRTLELRQRTEQLEREIEERQRAEAILAHRSEELANSNAELEAFSYSLSHDLRAPVRAIEGFAHLLSESYSARLDDQAREYLQRMASSTQRMHRLIGDMLKLFRMSRVEMHVTNVDSSEMAREILAELARTHPKAEVTLAIEPHVQVEADSSLLRVALENILSNAWKFTRDTPAPRIEIGTTHSAEGRTHYVRDNGAGFDGARAEEALQPFARLHSEAQYEGTGIGLAIVSRVFKRHGGKVWLVSQPGRGTTVYFRFGA